MGVIKDAFTESDSGGTAVSTLTWSHTIGANPDPILLVGAFYPNPIANYISGITYNGVALIKLQSAQAGPGVNTGRACDLWYILNPPAGAHNIVITSTSANSNMIGTGASFYGVSQSAPIGNSNKNTSTSATSLAVTTTGSNANDLIYAIAHTRSSGTSGVGAGQTKEYSYTIQTNELVFGSTQVGATSGTSTLTQSGAADYFAGCAATIQHQNNTAGVPNNFFGLEQ